MAALAADNWVLVFTQIPFTFLPAPMKRAAEAKPKRRRTSKGYIRSDPDQIHPREMTLSVPLLQD
jgi:hypothetical protein